MFFLFKNKYIKPTILIAYRFYVKIVNPIFCIYNLSISIINKIKIKSKKIYMPQNKHHNTHNNDNTNNFKETNENNILLEYMEYYNSDEDNSDIEFNNKQNNIKKDTEFEGNFEINCPTTEQIFGVLALSILENNK
jgi:hypothetical protein